MSLIERGRRNRVWGARAAGGRAVLAPVAVAVLLGVLVHVSVRVPVPAADARLYLRMGGALAGFPKLFITRDGLSTALSVRGYPYPLFLALVFRVLGRMSPGAVAWIQGVVIVPITVAIGGLAARRAFGPRVGLATAWLIAIWLPLQWHSLFLLTETFLGALLTLLLYLLVALVECPSRRTACALGVLSGVIALFHSAYQVLPFVLVVAVTVHLAVYRRDALRRVIPVVVIGALAVVVPYWCVHAVQGLPRLGQGGQGYGGGGGWTFYVGSRASTHWEPIPDDYALERSSAKGGLRALLPRIERGEVHVEARLRRVIERKVRDASPGSDPHLSDADYYRAGIENLVATAGRLPDKVAVSARDLFLTHSHWPTYEIPKRGLAAPWIRDVWRVLVAGAFVLMLVGLVRVAARRRERLVLFAPVAIQSAVFLTSTPESRYAYPLEASILMAVAVGILGPGRAAVKRAGDAVPATSGGPGTPRTGADRPVHEPSPVD